jgi:hypothetical protein
MLTKKGSQFLVIISIFSIYCSIFSCAFLPFESRIKTKEDLDKAIKRINPSVGSFIQNFRRKYEKFSTMDLEAKDKLRSIIFNLLERMVFKIVQETKRESFWTLRQG